MALREHVGAGWVALPTFCILLAHLADGFGLYRFDSWHLGFDVLRRGGQIRVDVIVVSMLVCSGSCDCDLSLCLPIHIGLLHRKA